VQRDKLHLTQQKVGDALEPRATRASIANIEAGKQRVLVHTLVQLASVLEVSVVDLLPERTDKSGVVRQELMEKLGLPKSKLPGVVDRLTLGRRRSG
jgi:transcriptional regulator with XRE-family HTH domain